MPGHALGQGEAGPSGDHAVEIAVLEPVVEMGRAARVYVQFDVRMVARHALERRGKTPIMAVDTAPPEAVPEPDPAGRSGSSRRCVRPRRGPPGARHGRLPSARCRGCRDTSRAFRSFSRARICSPTEALDGRGAVPRRSGCRTARRRRKCSGTARSSPGYSLFRCRLNPGFFKMSTAVERASRPAPQWGPVDQWPGRRASARPSGEGQVALSR